MITEYTMHSPRSKKAKCHVVDVHMTPLEEWHHNLNIKTSNINQHSSLLTSRLLPCLKNTTNYSQLTIMNMIRGHIMMNNNLNIKPSSTVSLNSIKNKSNQHRESFPIKYTEFSPRFYSGNGVDG